MFRKDRRALPALAAMAVCAGVVAVMSLAAASASAVTLTNNMENWAVWGSLTPKKLGEPVVLPKGSTYNGTAKLTTTPTEISGTSSGTIFVPPFNTSLKLGGLVPSTVA